MVSVKQRRQSSSAKFSSVRKHIVWSKSKVIENPQVFVVQQLPVEFMDEQVHMFPGAELLKRQFHQLDALGDGLWQASESFAGKFCHERILLDGIYFAGSQARQLNSKQTKAAAPLDTYSTVDELCMRSEQGTIGTSSLRIVVNGNKGQKVVDLAKTARRKLIKDIH